MSRSRRRRRRITVLAGGCLAGFAIAVPGLSIPGGSESPRDANPRPAFALIADAAWAHDGLQARADVPKSAGIDRAWRFGSSQEGFVSAAVIDPGRDVTALRGRRLFVSASVVKAVMLVALLRELSAAGTPLDHGTAARLEEMIVHSDNDAADEVYQRLGDDPIEEAAAAAGAVTLDVRGYWAETYLSARDAAAFMWSIERVLPKRHRAFGLRLLRGIVSYQRWGIPDAAPRGWLVAFKGGWRETSRGQLVHQMALLRCGRTRLALAVMTDGMRSMEAGTHTVEGVARRVLDRGEGRTCDS
jgi:Beta-lactamase enzyme family